jgi:hypothetical protein
MQRARSEFAAALELQRDTAEREKEIAARAAALASQHHEVRFMLCTSLSFFVEFVSIVDFSQAALKSVSDRAAAEMLVARAQWTAEASQLRDQAVQAAVAAARESCAREESAAIASARTFHERSLADVRAMLDVWQNECQQLRQQLNGQKGDESIVKQLEEERRQHLQMLAQVREEAAEAAENDRKRFADLSAERVRAETTLQVRILSPRLLICFSCAFIRFSIIFNRRVWRLLRQRCASLQRPRVRVLLLCSHFTFLASFYLSFKFRVSLFDLTLFGDQRLVI